MRIDFPALMFSKENKTKFVTNLIEKVSATIIDNSETGIVSISSCDINEIERSLLIARNYKKTFN